MKIYFIFIYFLIGSVSADIQIQSYKKKYSWKQEWSLFLREELKKEEYREGQNALLSLHLDEEDLDELECDGYNLATFDEKTDFWIVFFSALTRAESAFNEKALSPKTKGHRNFGLLQLSKQTAKTECAIAPPEKNVLNAEDNLKCGLRLMTWQLLGAPNRLGKKMRPDLEGQLFGKYIFQWGPLRQKDHRGRALLVDWFKDHLDQLNFCHLKTK
jgi:hypothetical protein